jgi:hypothetical protein
MIDKKKELFYLGFLLVSNFQQSTSSELIWYPTPPVNITPVPQLQHSNAYLIYKERQNPSQNNKISI